MAVRIRFRRTGGKKQASYRVVVADSRSPRDGRFIENIGHYNPRTDPATFEINEERARYWLSVGAQPSDAVDRIFKTMGLWDRYERFKGGEDVEKLLKEAADAEASRNIDGKTRREAPKKSAKKAEAEAPAEEPKAEAKEEPKAEEAKKETKKKEPKAEESKAEEAKEEPAAEEEKPEAAADEEKKAE